MKTRLLLLAAAAGFMAFPAWAELNLEPLLNKVTLQFTAKQWITTQTALVQVDVNAAVNDQGIEQIQNTVLSNLNSLAKSDWHIVSFNRQQDASGLEKIQIVAESRLPQGQLTDLRNKAKTMSKPGETYTLDSVQFTPSDEEVRRAFVQLRQNIYQQAQAEIATLDKIYPDQKFYIHQLDFG